MGSGFAVEPQSPNRNRCGSVRAVLIFSLAIPVAVQPQNRLSALSIPSY